MSEPTFEELRGELVRLRDVFALVSQEPARAAGRRAGTGGWWELSGYADVLSDALKRIHAHRKRVEGIDRQIAREAR
jgi:hypothetical protein